MKAFDEQLAALKAVPGHRIPGILDTYFDEYTHLLRLTQTDGKSVMLRITASELLALDLLASPNSFIGRLKPPVIMHLQRSDNAPGASSASAARKRKHRHWYLRTW